MQHPVSTGEAAFRGHGEPLRAESTRWLHRAFGAKASDEAARPFRELHAALLNRILPVCGAAPGRVSLYFKHVI